MRPRAISGSFSAKPPGAGQAVLPSIKAPMVRNPLLMLPETSPTRRATMSPSRPTRALPSLAIATSQQQAATDPVAISSPTVGVPSAQQHRALPVATSSSCDYITPAPGTILQCCCCLDTIDLPAGACSSCGEDESVSLPLCAKCFHRHSQPEAFRKLRGHRFTALKTAALEPLSALGLNAAASGLCPQHGSEPVRYFCREATCGVGLCAQCVSQHSGHAFVEASAAHSTLRAALLERVFSSSCWPDSAPTASTATLQGAPGARAHPLAEDELLDRLDFNSAARRSLADELAAASQAATEAFDAASTALAAALEARKTAVLAEIAAAGAAKMAALEGEADSLVAAWDGVCDVAAGVRCAAEALQPAQFAGLYPELSARVSAALASASALPQGRLMGAHVSVDTGGLALLTAGVKAVGAVVIDVPRQPAHAEFGGMGAAELAAALTAHIDAPGVLQWAVTALCVLADRGAGNGSIDHEGCIPALLRVLATHGASDALLAGRVAEALRFLARSASNRRAAVDLGCVRVLAAVLGAHVAGSAAVAESCCLALANLTAEEAVECVDTLPAVVAVFEAHAALAGPLEAACGALRNMANDAANCAAAAGAGVFPAVLGALASSHCAGSAAFVEACCGALGNFAALPANQHELGLLGAAPLLVDALKPHAHVSWVGEAICIALGNLALCDENRVAYVAGAVDAAAGVLSLHGADPVVAEAATIALRNMLRGIKDDRGAAACSSAVAPLARIGAVHSNVPAIVSASVTALHSLSADPGNCTAAARHGAVPIVAESLRVSLAAVLDGDGAPSLETLRASFDILCRIALQLGAGEGVVASLPVPDLVSAMGLCGVLSKPESAEAACGVLVTLINASPTCAEAVLGSGGVPVLLRALRLYADRPAIPSLVSRAVATLASASEERRVAVVGSGAVDALLEFLRRRCAVVVPGAEARGATFAAAGDADALKTGPGDGPGDGVMAAFQALRACTGDGSDATLADGSIPVLASLARKWPLDALLLSGALRLVRALLTAVPKYDVCADPRVLALGAVAAAALSDHESNADVVDGALFLLHVFVVASAGGERVPAPASAAPAVVRLLSSTPRPSLPLSLRCLETLRLCEAAAGVDSDTRAAAVAPLTDLLLVSGDADVRAAVCALLRKVIVGQVRIAVPATAAAAAIEALFAIIAAQPPAPITVVEDACATLDFLIVAEPIEAASGDPPVPRPSPAAAALAERGPLACSAVFAAMRANAASRAVALHGCRVLRAIADLNGGGAFDLVDSSAFAAISAALVAHSASAAVLEDACWLIRWLLRHPASDAATAARAVPGTVHLLEVHIAAAPPVITAVARTLLALTADNEARAAAAVRAGALPFVLATLSGPAADPAIAGPRIAGAVALAGVELLRCLGSSGSEGRAAAARLGAVPAVLSVLGAGAGDAAVVAAACEAIRALAASSEARAAAVKAGAIPALIDATLRGAHVGVAAVVSAGCGTLRHLALHSDARGACLAAGALGPLIAALRQHSSDSAAAEPACALLRSLTQSPESKAESARLGGLEALVAVLEAHVQRAAADGAAVIEAALSALRSLAMHAENKAPAARAGAIEAVVRALQTQPGGPSAAAAAAATPPPSVLEAGCGALRTLVFTPDNKVVAARAGAVPALVQILRGSHAGVPGVVESACAALRSLSANVDNQAAAARCGGVDAVVSALAAHSGSAGAVQAAAGALRNLCVNNDNEAAAATAGAIPLVLAALQTHASAPATVEAALGALHSLSGSAENKTAAGAAGAVTLVLAALRAYPDTAGVAEAAWGALRNLAVDHTNEAAAVEGGALPLAVLSLQTHASAAGVVDAALGALANLAYSAPHMAAAAACGAVDATVAALRRHGASASSAEAGCCALRSFTADDEVKVAAGRAGAVALVAAALNTHLGSASVAEAALGALANLSFNEGNRSAAVRDARAVPLCVAALKRHGGSATLARAAAGCLCCLVAGDAEAQEEAVDAGAVPLLGAVRARHGEGSRAGENATKALAALAVRGGAPAAPLAPASPAAAGGAYAVRAVNAEPAEPPATPGSAVHTSPQSPSGAPHDTSSGTEAGSAVVPAAGLVTPVRSPSVPALSGLASLLFRRDTGAASGTRKE